MTNAPRILVIGTASFDTLHLPSGTTRTIGGAGLYTALAAAAAGAEVTLCAPRPEPLPESFAPAATRVKWIGPVIAPDALPRLEIAHDGGGNAKLIDAAWGAEAQLAPQHLPTDLTGCAFVHVAALSSAQRMLDFATACRARGARHLSAGTYARLAYGDAERVRALLVSCDAFFMNANEARGLFGDNAPSTTLNRLLFVTDAANGATIIRGSAHVQVPAPTARELDPTGAGDTFCGTTLAALAAGRTPTDAATLGCLAASRMIEREGPAALIAYL
jgi:sugar/nucleoside kinase (ribokinase family)